MRALTFAAAIAVLLPLAGCLVGIFSHVFLTPPLLDFGRLALWDAGMGSFRLALMTATLALPLGIGLGLWVAYWAEAGVASVVRRALGFLETAPPLTAGIFALWLFLPESGVRSEAPALFALTLLLAPRVAVAIETLQAAVPEGLVQAALALGASRSQTILQVVIPQLGARAMAPLLFTIAGLVGEAAPLLFIVQARETLATSVFALAATNTAHDGAWTAGAWLLLFVVGSLLLTRSVARFRPAERP